MVLQQLKLCTREKNPCLFLHLITLLLPPGSQRQASSLGEVEQHRWRLHVGDVRSTAVTQDDDFLYVVPQPITLPWCHQPGWFDFSPHTSAASPDRSLITSAACQAHYTGKAKAHFLSGFHSFVQISVSCLEFSILLVFFTSSVKTPSYKLECQVLYVVCRWPLTTCHVCHVCLKTTFPHMSVVACKCFPHISIFQLVLCRGAWSCGE